MTKRKRIEEDFRSGTLWNCRNLAGNTATPARVSGEFPESITQIPLQNCFGNHESFTLGRAIPASFFGIQARLESMGIDPEIARRLRGKFSNTSVLGKVGKIIQAPKSCCFCMFNKDFWKFMGYQWGWDKECTRQE